MAFKEVSKQQLQSWREKYGEQSVLALDFRTEQEVKEEVTGKRIYFVQPEKTDNYFHTAKRALNLSMSGDEVGAAEIIFNECYLGGLGEKQNIEVNSAEYVSAVLKCTNLLTVLEANFTTV